MINNDKNLERCHNEWLESYDWFLDTLSECDEETFDKFDICSDCMHCKLCEYHEIEPDDLGLCDFYDKLA